MYLPRISFEGTPKAINHLRPCTLYYASLFIRQTRVSAGAYACVSLDGTEDDEIHKLTVVCCVLCRAWNVCQYSDSVTAWWVLPSLHC